MGILTADQREMIRLARAAVIAADREQRIRDGFLQACSVCGCDADLESLAYTDGCSGCWERRRARTEGRREYNRSSARKSYDRRRRQAQNADAARRYRQRQREAASA